ncbi:MAG: NAD(P)H-binding protein, partial [Kiritimatiellae bacterium]|nr:NAD(P)H-binding protein [Kiritimatiellia bacterium]
MSTPPLLLITGATGYVGGRLLERLSKEPVRLRAMARKPEGVQARWGEHVEVKAGDVLDPASLPDVLEGVETAYYLIHSMGGGGDFEAKEAESARNFGNAAREAGVKRIVFLGGLADERQGLSAHMRSRHQTGRILRESGVPVIEFRASIILGAGSLSFEMIRALVQRLPIMITPKWVHVEAQPIAVEDLISYLVQVLEVEETQSGIYEIGGADVVSYKEIMNVYARARGLNRWFLPVPVLSPYLSSLWLGLVTPLFARVGKKLIESVTHPSVIQNPAAKGRFSVEPCGVEHAIRQALEEEDRGYALTRWSDSLSSGNTLRTWAGVRFGTRLVDSRVRECPIPPERVFQAVEKIGGATGWYYADFLWKIRGAMDELVGGVGMRRGRRHPTQLRVGDV